MKFIEELIKDAQKQGKFKGLKNEGNHVGIEDNPFTEETRIAYGMVKDAGYTLGFLANRKKIVEEVAQLMGELKSAADQYTGNTWTRLRWAKATEVFRENANKLNRRIRDYNLKAPNEKFHIIPVWVDREIERHDPIKDE
ncbi:MAG: DnaJ family domain-containing protein [Chloroflexota bacterium]